MTIESVIRRKPNVVTLCMFKGACSSKHLKNNDGHRWKKGLLLCTFNGTCNQKVVMDHIGASKKYGIPK